MDPILIAAALLRATGLGDWIGDKLQGLIGDKAAKKIIDVASTVTGVTNIDDLLRAVQANKEFADKLREKLIDNEQEIVRLDYSDRSNARAMQVAALQQQDEFAKRFVYWYAWYWSIAASLYIGFITFGQIPQQNVRFADTILGFVLGTVITTILMYFYGASFSNRMKDFSITNLIDAVKSK